MKMKKSATEALVMKYLAAVEHPGVTVEHGGRPPTSWDRHRIGPSWRRPT